MPLFRRKQADQGEVYRDATVRPAAPFISPLSPPSDPPPPMVRVDPRPHPVAVNPITFDESIGWDDFPTEPYTNSVMAHGGWHTNGWTTNGWSIGRVPREVPE